MFTLRDYIRFQEFQVEQVQDFQYFVVIDFEATCNKENNFHPQEIIEFPSVLVNGVSGELQAYFQTYVKPTYHPKLTDFCKQLTGIQQDQVDKGVSIREAIELHDKSLQDMGVMDTNFAVVTWSNWDCKVMLETECRLKGIPKPDYFNRWINLRVAFSDVFGSEVRCNLKGAVEMAGLVWEGRQHCGLDDAMNTACLLVHLMQMGYKFCITNSVMSSSQQQQQQSLPDQHYQYQQRSTPDYQHYYLQQQSLPENIQSTSDMEEQYCYCGVKSSRGMVKKPGPKHGNIFFGCGNWSATRGAKCSYFEWVPKATD